MPVTPTGPAALPLARLRELLSSSTTWQTWTASDDADEAAEDIYLVAKRPDAGESWSELRPMAIVDYAESEAWRRTRDSEMGQTDEWRFEVLFEADVPAEYADDLDEADLTLWMLNNVGAVLDEIWDSQGATNPADGANTFIVLRATAMGAVMRTNDNADPTSGDALMLPVMVEAASI